MITSQCTAWRHIGFTGIDLILEKDKASSNLNYTDPYLIAEQAVDVGELVEREDEGCQVVKWLKRLMLKLLQPE